MQRQHKRCRERSMKHKKLVASRKYSQTFTSSIWTSSTYYIYLKQQQNKVKEYEQTEYHRKPTSYEVENFLEQQYHVIPSSFVGVWGLWGESTASLTCNKPEPFVPVYHSSAHTYSGHHCKTPKNLRN